MGPGSSAFARRDAGRGAADAEYETRVFDPTSRQCKVHPSASVTIACVMNAGMRSIVRTLARTAHCPPGCGALVVESRIAVRRGSPERDFRSGIAIAAELIVEESQHE